ncbi:MULTISPECIES: hypothetical protein [Aeromonas]|uniref:hypothetical protein n=1 Tax=Aeromonas TaxID=642 RepID=UPI0022E44BB1|nr:MULTISPECIES: hypothetical protein [Aeromonas]
MKHFTKHGEKRSQQRGITMAMLMALDSFGVEIQQKGGTVKAEIPRNRDVRQSIRDLAKILIILVDNDVYSIEGNMNEIITVGHKHS